MSAMAKMVSLSRLPFLDPIKLFDLGGTPRKVMAAVSEK
jgi:hypothetical protein